jgi:hypothetical protein
VIHVALVLAHCGANWKYCDSGTAVAGIGIIGGMLWAGKRAERRKHERVKELRMQALSKALQQAHAQQRGEAPAPRSGTRKKKR